MAAGQIDIFGKFHASTAEGILAVTSEIKDEHFNKTQAELNLEFSENQGGVSSVAGLTGDILAADLLEALNLDDVVSNVSVLMQRTNWDNYFGIDQETGAIFVKPIDENTPRGFYSLGYISAGGVGSSQGGGGGGADLLDVWVSLRDNNPGEDFYNWKINPGHIPGLPWSQITSGKPTTLSGYGITDAYTKTQVDNLIDAIDLTPYLLASVAAQTYATITSLEAVSARVSVLEGRTNWDDYLGVDADGNIYVKMNGQDARGFYSYGFIAAGGVGDSGGGGGEGASLLAVWRSLTNNNSLVDADITSTLKIATAHIPDVASVYGYLKQNETITLTGVVTGSGTTTIATSIADGAISISKISGLGDAATYGIGSVASGDGGLVTGGAVYTAITNAVADEALLRANADNALSARIAVFEGMFELVDGNIHVKNNRGFYSDSFISAGGVGSSSGGGGGADLLDVWVSLRDNDPNEDFYNWKVNAGHLPLGSGLTVDANGNINVGTAGSVAWANVTGKPTTVSGYGITDAVTSASYNSTTKHIELKCGNVVISYIDATAFIKDGMVSNVQVTGGYLVISFNTDAGQEDIRIPISDIFNADNYYDKTASDARFFLAENFTAANIVSTLGNTPVARASRLDGDTALSIWGVEYWANGVPKAVSARPGLYVAGTQVNINANKDTLLGVTAISNGLSSGSSDESRIEWDATNHAWHFYGGIYADTFVTAGGTNASGGGGGDVDLDRVWESLTNNIDFPNVKINLAHIPDDDRLSYVDPNAGEDITIDDPGVTGTVLWGAESANVVSLDVNGVSKILVKQTALDGINSAISTLSALIGTKQDYISDLSSIRSNASLGATAHGWGDHRTYGYLTSVPTASASVLGLIRIGTGLTIDGSGVVSVTGQTVGTVTSVGLSMPTGFSVGSSPITSSGTIAVTFASGYSLPSNATQATWTAKYDKPSTGIPKTHLESSVQTSLEKADTALQSHQTVTLASGTNNGTLKLTTAAGTTDNVAVTGLGTAAYRGVASTIGASITNLVPGSLLYAVLGDAFDSTNTVKAFVNSSIATATATYQGSYNLVSDLELDLDDYTRAQIAFRLGTVITGEDNNDYAFVEIPTSESTPTQIASIERYKFNGTSWAYEYTLNNSGFTAAQWSAINSGITSTLVAAFNAKYDKPSGGIPKTDLASDVQTSLGLADSALQSHQTIYGLTIKNSAGTNVLLYNPDMSSGTITLKKTMVGLGNVENFVYVIPTGAEQTYTYPV